MKSHLIIIILMSSFVGFSQNSKNEEWTKNELTQYSKLTELAKYIYKKEKSEISKDTLFKKYIYFDYVLNDNNIERKENRLEKFDTIFYYFRKTIDSLGLKKLNAKPIRFYKNHEIYKPFDKNTNQETVSGEKMYTKDDNVFVYFKKEEPENPLGVVLFEGTTNKLGSWILINQGGYHYFLTFSLL